MRALDLNTHQKAFKINLDPAIYGTFAEIGAGQEIARCFFRVGGAAGTIAKTMSAYDMTFSDAIYGKSSRYVSRERLDAMLAHEFDLLIERLGSQRGASTTFFAFADTVSARNYRGSNECHGWIGIRFQTRPQGPANDIVLHVNLLDRENVLQQEALGILGVNLVFGAFFQRDNIDEFLANMLGDLTVQRIEIDMLEFSGPDFETIDNRLLAVKLIQSDLANAIVFDAGGELRQPSSVVYKSPILIERGSFRALKQLKVETINRAGESFKEECTDSSRAPVSLIEVTVNPLIEDDAPLDHEVLSRVTSLVSLGHSVMVSKYVEFYALTRYLRRYTQEPIALVMGVSTLVRIFNERYYQDLEGGVLEGVGRLFMSGVSAYVYPMTVSDFTSHLKEASMEPEPWIPGGARSLGVDSVIFPYPLKHLFNYLVERKYIKLVRA
ncbi:MAG: TonB-dependent receptor [Deltaproteobacteria bacterium]|nr:TonB-dependent receptor [Deltaproteobacteria bacterium]